MTFKLKLRDDRPATIGERRQMLNEIESLRERLDFAEFEWNRATDGMKERDATIESLRAQLAAANEHFKKVEAIGHEVEAQLASLKTVKDE